MTRLAVLMTVSVTLASCAAGAVVSDAGSAGDTGARMDTAAASDAVGDATNKDATEGAADSPGGDECPKERPIIGSPCTPPGLHCESKCLGLTPYDQFWTADCSRIYGIWSANSHPCAPEFK